MTLDLTNPESIASWYAIAPRRHGALLKHWLQQPMWAGFKPAIEAAREIVKGAKC